MDSEESRKLCAACGADLTDQDHHRSRRGKYYCLACQEERRSTLLVGAGSQRLYRCVFCNAQVARKDCHRNRYGEYVCRSCQSQGRRWSASQSTRRSLRHAAGKLWRITRPLIYLGACLAALGVAYVVLGKIIQTVTPSPR